MFVGQADGSGQVLQFDTSGNLLNTFSPTGEDRGTDWIDLAADQHTLHYTSEGSLVKQFDLASSSQLPDFASGLPAPCYAHRILADGGELVACASEVVRLDASGAQVQTYAVGQNLFALNVDPDRTSFWTADFGGTVFHVDIASGNVINSFDANPLSEVAGLAVVGEPTVATDAKITAAGAAGFSAVEGRSATGTVATFTDPDTGATAGEYSASINWGDGSTSAGTISGSGGSFTIAGTHTYAEEGSHTITVTITDVDNQANSATATTPATVTDAALHGTGVNVKSKPAFNGVVANFTDDDPAGTVSDYTASIDWGDGSKSSGTIAAGFKVNGSHTYKKSGTYKVTVTIRDAGGATVTVTSTVTILSSVVVRHGNARLTGVPGSCVLAGFRLQVRGRFISSVRFYVGNHRLRSRTVHRGNQYAAMVSLSPGKHRLTVKVTFRRSSHTRSRTFHRTVSGCPIRPPKFTG
jgi:PKD repeat protein